MIRIKGLDHIVIRVQNTEAMIAFYCDVLGCVVTRRSSSDFGLVQLRAGDSLIDIVAVDSEIGRKGVPHPEKRVETWTTSVSVWNLLRKKRFAITYRVTV